MIKNPLSFSQQKLSPPKATSEIKRKLSQLERCGTVQGLVQERVDVRRSFRDRGGKPLFAGQETLEEFDSRCFMDHCVG